MSTSQVGTRQQSNGARPTTGLRLVATIAVTIGGLATVALVGAGPAAAKPSVAPVATPARAQAAEPQIELTVDVDSVELRSGGQANVSYEVANNGTMFVGQVGIRTGDNLRCSGQCGRFLTLDSGERQTFSAKITAGDVPAGERRRTGIAISAGNARRDVQMEVVGPDRPQSVGQISGRVAHADSGNGVAGALVKGQDSVGNFLTVETDGEGRYWLRPRNDRPLYAGQIVLTASAATFTTTRQTIRIAPREDRRDVRLTLRPQAQSSPSPSPSAQPSVEPTEEPAEPPAEEPGPGGARNTSSDSSGPLTWILILVGGLMLALGVGALVLLILRRRQDRNGASGVGAQPHFPRQPPGPPAHTAALPSSALSNAPTVVQPAIRDEYADPYGLPPGVQGVPPHTATLAPIPAYGDMPTQTTPPAYGEGYGTSHARPERQQDAGATQLYDEPTGRFTGQTSQPLTPGSYLGAVGTSPEPSDRRLPGYDPDGRQPQPSPREQYERRMMEWMDD
ncbi:carboxypeptidase regulatory-like domain-containing protein [Pilimelia columellifera]|uniref:Carboxypeptidase regulatory-like domain-containing protein n=1 Tax=Pilimelia columellifera subsp. columellifera TaxID=706583 RepID=A0ABP6AD89_9ACTN